MIGDNLKRVRLERGMSISQLAEEASVSKSYLSSIERNIQTNPSIQFIEKICLVLGISICDLINDDEKVKFKIDETWKKSKA
ncbi:helix-turn-helix domain-containing protein [Oceanobacillus halophilus]|uniref:XRE family transcriptional regulator n=1 Tax=Oceanobacillus halophilus TaxID=930130 RepID=A0A495A6Z7_9BACI|nr:XRE family transcriptional regulator [Oceanobacillus halophilus]